SAAGHGLEEPAAGERRNRRKEAVNEATQIEAMPGKPFENLFERESPGIDHAKERNADLVDGQRADDELAVRQPRRNRVRRRSPHWLALWRINALDSLNRRSLGIPIHSGRDTL